MKNRGLPDRGLKPAAELYAGNEHGTRGRYLAGCKCFYCRRANSDYERERQAARIAGDWNGIVSAWRAKNHIGYLSRCGIGRRMVVERSGVAKTVICEIKSGKKKNIRARTERAILAVEPILLNTADYAIIDAGPTWERIREIQLRGYRKAQIARLLGFVGAGIQIGRERCTGRNARKVRELWIRLCYVKT